MLANGVDLIEVHRIQEAIEKYGDRFLNRIYTQNELAQVGENSASLAARFAAKEAVSKTLGTGIGAVKWLEIEILHNAVRQPTLHLHGTARQVADEKGLVEWAISLSHTQTLAIAMVVASGE